ncbi:MAG: S-methyl-5-thioribose-1-phosphate isomerase [Planctomycetaceae bacterium]|jgi:methylthioribose-1-phosphate isomerase|nr:S-methyl-5-thioribose-1-phosphate isomerase [Planctomycetaceae bacterium]
MSNKQNIETLSWVEEECFARSRLRMIDQTLLPVQLKQIDCRTIETVWEAIKMLRVRGAPAIGIAAAYGVCIGLQPLFTDGNIPDEETFFAKLYESVRYLAASRPTAVNLFWALDRMKELAESYRGKKSVTELADLLLAEAKAIHEEDRRICRAIGRYGAELVKDGASLLTHCNAGGLATADYGTALAVFFAAQEAGKKIHVFADETRPLLQGARLTAWELLQHGIDVTLICDSMAAMVMRQGKIDAVFVGADRITVNGDTANKIGTYSVAAAAKTHGIPFYVAAPVSTFDLTLAEGSLIPIEERDPKEITHSFGTQTAPDGVRVYNPAFDVTPAPFITGIITEFGVISPVNTETIAGTVGKNRGKVTL